MDRPGVELADVAAYLLKEQGYDVPQDMFSHALDHLQQDANGTAGDLRNARALPGQQATMR